MSVEKENLRVKISEEEELVYGTSLKPTGHHIVILAAARPKKTEFGIILPAEALQGTEWDTLERGGRQKGTVLAIGPQAFRAYAEASGIDSDWCALGDEVLYARYSGKTVLDPLTGQDVYVIQDGDVISVYGKEVSHVEPK